MASYPTPAMNDLQSQNYLQFLPPSALGGVPMNMQMPSNQSGNSQMHSPMMASPGMPPGMQQMLHHFPMPPQGNAYEQYHHMAVPGPSAPPVPPSSLPNISMGPSSASAYPASPVLNSPSAAGTIRKRRFSSAKIQPTRVKKVMQSDEEIGRMVASVPVAIGRAMEHFAEKFLMASSAAVYGTNGRTLAPAHMKLAMMANPHFAFLEPLLKDIGVPARQANDIPFAVCQTPMPAPIPSPTMPSDMGMCLPPQQMAACSATSAPPLTSPTPQQQQQQLPPAPVSARRSSSGPKERPDLAPGEKPKRGRPRKIKKVEKCIDDELANLPTERELMPPPMMLPPSRMNGVCETVNPMVGGGGGEEGGEQDKDRCLMPPPSLPISPRHALHNQNTIAQNGTDGLLPGDKE